MDEPTEREAQQMALPQQVQWVDPPHDFKVPWKNNTLFVIDGMLWQVYEMKRPKPYGRALVRLLKIAVSVPLSPESSVPESLVPISESPTGREEFESESYSPKSPQ